MTQAETPRHPLSTYRLQLHAEFTFDDAAALVPYLKRLGIDAVYLSPISLATPGSQHGYDVCDPTRLNPELGGEEGFARLSNALRAEGLGCVVDLVPNHMGAHPEHNPYWRDVLEKGRASKYANFFDIDWDPPRQGLKGKVLLPVLGDAYGAVLERGELGLIFEDGRFLVDYSGRRFPVNVESEPSLVRATEASASEGGASAPEALSGAVEKALGEFRGAPGDGASWDRLHALLERQSYRLANWKTAQHEINYRRFFDVSELLGLRMDRPEVFDLVHGRLLALVREGRVTGLRIDHIDGLRDPLAYLKRLREEIGPLYLLVEKILCGDEPLRAEWPVQGTTGYEVINDINGIFLDPAGLGKLRRRHRRFTDRARSVAEEERLCKRLLLSTSLASELHALAVRLDRLSEADRRSRDFTLEALRHALRETIACLGLYRTYGDASGFSPEDRAAVDGALKQALALNPAADPALFAFLRAALLPEEGDASPLSLESRLDFALRFQQLTGPVQAKGVEDTVLYRQTALLSVNEVGGSAASQGLSPEDFHRRVSARARDWPANLNGGTTHDTKRGEDHRARLNTLSETPDAWTRALHALERANASWTGPDGVRPSRDDEYLFYQSLIGCWQLDENGEPMAATEAFVERVRSYMNKAAHEAKEHTTWISPNEAYEKALDAFVNDVLTGPWAARSAEILLPLVKTCAEGGARNSLNQVAARCALPGVPDVYRGSETWELSLADPDNRRPVAYEALENRLRALEPHLDPDTEFQDRKTLATELWSNWADGGVKQYVLARALRWRQAHADLFTQGDYEPLGFEGTGWVGFTRSHGNASLAVCLRTRVTGNAEGRLRLPPDWTGHRVVNLFTGTVFVVGSEGLDLAALAQDFPTAWLWRAESV